VRVAVIGAAGKTGTRLVRQSLQRGHEVVAVLISARRLKATELVTSLASACWIP